MTTERENNQLGGIKHVCSYDDGPASTEYYEGPKLTKAQLEALWEQSRKEDDLVEFLEENGFKPIEVEPMFTVEERG